MSTPIKDIDSFYCNLLILINTCIIIELLSFLLGELKMAIIFRSIILIITSVPIINHLLPNSPFHYCYNASLMNKLLYYLLLEDSIIFIIIRQGSYLLYYVFLVYFPLFALYYIINKESIHFMLQKTFNNNQQNSIV